jgi:Cdc6-like AAA superfamily ATPase
VNPSLSPSSPEKMQRYLRSAQVFTPSAPIDSQELFAGRADQINQVMSAIVQKGQHVIVYGERGVGKTSFVTVISQIMRSFSEQEIQSAIVNCDGTDNFASLWKKIFREFDFPVSNVNLNSEEIAPETIRYLFQRNPIKTIIVMDEFDRLEGDQTTTELLADTIKTLSDHLVDTTLILVGVAGSVNELIAEHNSIERSLVQVQMPRMSANESYELLDKRFKLLDMTAQPLIKERIVFLSQGLPSYTHLLALHSSQKAISRNSDVVESTDLEFAIKMAIEKAYQSILNAYHQAVSSSRETIYAQVLLACALTKKDDLGFFAPPDVVAPMSTIMKKKYPTTGFSRHLNEFCDEKRSEVLCKRGVSRNYRFRFVNPMMQPYVIMHGLATGLISQDDLDGFK